MASEIDYRFHDRRAPLNLTGYYSFDHGDARDIVGQGYGNAAITNGTVTGKQISQTSTGLVRIPDSATNDLPGKFTVTGWVYQTSLTGTQIIFSSKYVSTGNSRSVQLWMDGSSYYQCIIASNGNLSGNYTNHRWQISGITRLNTWVHYALVFDNTVTPGANGMMKLYINGTLATIQTNFANGSLGLIPYAGNSHPIGLGCSVESTTFGIVGKIDDFKIWTGKAFTQTELRNIIENGRTD